MIWILSSNEPSLRRTKISQSGRKTRLERTCRRRYFIILPKKFITKLILRCEHERLLPDASLSYHLSESDWPFAARSTIRDVLRKCIRCNRRTQTTWWANYQHREYEFKHPFSVRMWITPDRFSRSGFEIRSQRKPICTYLCAWLLRQSIWKAPHHRIVPELSK